MPIVRTVFRREFGFIRLRPTDKVRIQKTTRAETNIA
jgi:hypothetical protein